MVRGSNLPYNLIVGSFLNVEEKSRNDLERLGKSQLSKELTISWTVHCINRPFARMLESRTSENVHKIPQ